VKILDREPSGTGLIQAAAGRILEVGEIWRQPENTDYEDEGRDFTDKRPAPGHRPEHDRGAWNVRALPGRQQLHLSKIQPRRRSALTSEQVRRDWRDAEDVVR
jgi:hypothetical protein